MNEENSSGAGPSIQISLEMMLVLEEMRNIWKTIRGDQENTDTIKVNTDRVEEQDRINNPEREGENKRRCTYKTFKDADPPIFKGDLDLHVANTWIKEMEKVIEIFECLDEQKVKFATHFLRGEAVFWWDTVKQTEDCSTMTWTRFKELFFDKYFPTCMKNEMEMKFLGLKQEGMSVSKYLSKFLELSRFAPHQVNTEVRKSRIAEREYEARTQFFNNKKRGRETEFSVNLGYKKDNKKFQKTKKEGFGGYDRKTTIPECKKCGLKHGGDICYRADGLCYNCGERGHIATQCPKPKVISYQGNAHRKE
ncbi:uncharacterized protein LOC135151548 [Daucus carota subsp. sativus]|uniref:uncharacterized protein LOC135151548 n=1 Tax=Daucus carota subsp. sativus TaxID=79200 RepID=UPI003082A92E